MKNIILITLLFIGQYNLYGQERHKTDSITGHRLVNHEINLLEKKGVKKIITFFDDSGKVIMIWKDDKEKLKSVRMFYKGIKKGLRKKQRLSKKDKGSIDFILKNSELINSISKEFCNEKAHSFNKVYVNIKLGSENLYGNFFSHCSQVDKKAEHLSSLYLNLREPQ